MRSYEALYIIKPSVEAEQIPAVVEKFKQLIVDNGGEVTNVDEWGKRRLAYEVEKHREGYYVLMNFKSPAQTAHELERIFKIADEILRYLVIRLDEKKAS
ncbi:30S ribosomal protein S6 [Zhaonella formicivorans]|uniref:30S ribosomal protein S6 n=1 Tax=Zhaonella formicivorans TaxID=2528593 RepID=UPI0010D44A71|nr:30S ribosomal protein S6 [Zhaonella formicivorans]